MKGTLRIERNSVAAALAVAIVFFVVTFAVIAYILPPMIIVVMDFLGSRGIQQKGAGELVGFALWMGLTPLLAYVVSRLVFERMRWRWVVDASSPRCLQCGYDLTGNTSRVCPECGRKLQFFRIDDRE